MKFLELKIPPVALVFLFIALMWWLSANTGNLGIENATRLAALSILTLMSVAICLAGVLAFKAQKTTVNPIKPETSSSLVQSGIYRFTRNPMYLGMALFLMGCGVYFDNAYAIACVLLFVLYMTKFQIQPEESALTKIFGQAFVDYMRTTRRWI
ncbi:isoprenylcysteine carboxylmethyltransferase family protein [Enterovibrio sp. ZSDZ35]|uniref:Isoprenylcysteine carboxylmethyltransferase family protein n=1 Tax=Enterovibrio qingdaonensis TaxID=2899818 RepID=A0ABT5QQF4_9GAMM|nr:isoprenylcysteine carboxylmethyltransferase family protein [Enterovibrio sp. ZSDZ35]MDD1782730.1 isoprenylcysteine carboxylmethyltransferase family protein [Enterovibrio sp. ZSDZ35]